MYVSISPNGSVSYGDTPLETMYFQSLDFYLDFDEGTLTVNGKVDTITYCTKERDADKGFTHEEMRREAGKRLLEIAKGKGYKFYKEL